MPTRRILLINPKANGFTTRPVYFNRALYSPLAGLLTVAALIPKDEYEIVLTDENIESIDFETKVDMVGISAMTSFAKRGYEIADTFRKKGIPVLMGGVHPSFMPNEAIRHADAVVVGEAEWVMPRILSDLKRRNLRGIYKADRLHDLKNLSRPRYDLLKADRYFNKAFVQTSRGCHHACKFCTEHMMNGLRFRFRPTDEVIREIEACGQRTISINDADFFGHPSHAVKTMRALKGLGIRWQAGVNSRAALNDELLELAAESGCYMLSIGLESISLETLKDVHKYQNRPETFERLVRKIHSHGILVFGLFMFGFDHDDLSVFDETSRFTIDTDFDMCAYSLFTPYPGTMGWFELLKQNRIFSFDWDKYDQGHVLFHPTKLTPEQLRDGFLETYRRFYTIPSMLKRFPVTGGRSKLHWTIYNLFLRRGTAARLDPTDIVAPFSAPPPDAAAPPVVPERTDWHQLVEETNRDWPQALQTLSQ